MSAEQEAAYAVVVQLFDGMRQKDEALLRGAVTEDMSLVTTGERDGVPFLSRAEGGSFVESVLGARAELDEQIWDPVVQVSDRLATVWVRYALYVNGNFSHCGVDAFQLFKGEDGWRIFHIADTRRREDCWEPPGR